MDEFFRAVSAYIIWLNLNSIDTDRYTVDPLFDKTKTGNYYKASEPVRAIIVLTKDPYMVANDIAVVLGFAGECEASAIQFVTEYEIGALYQVKVGDNLPFIIVSDESCEN